MYFLFRLKISSSLSIKTSSESFTIFSSGLLSVNKAVVVDADATTADTVLSVLLDEDDDDDDDVDFNLGLIKLNNFINIYIYILIIYFKQILRFY